jgi:hypothetical protein
MSTSFDWTSIPIDVAACILAGYSFPVYPVKANKVPACPHGYKDGTIDPEEALRLFDKYPAPLIGIATGDASGIDVLDLDITKHPEAADWYESNKHRIPAGLVHESRSGGLHIFFNHHPGLRCSTARPVLGIDVRADGGGIIWWPAAGCRVLANDGPSDWPQWLLDVISPPPAPPVPKYSSRIQLDDAYVQGALNQAINNVMNAPPGARNSTLNSEMWSLLRFLGNGELTADAIAKALAVAAHTAGLGPAEIKATLMSAMRARGV